MPSAPPNSALVSEIPEAAPACSGGAEPTMMSVARVITGLMPTAMTNDPRRRSGTESTLTWLNIARPIAATDSPAATTRPGRNRRTIRGARLEPMMNAAAEGNDHSPA